MREEFPPSYGYSRDGYTPTPDEISRKCEEIRQRWGDSEFRKRAGCALAGPVETRVIQVWSLESE